MPIFRLAALVELATGIALLAAPSLVIDLLLGGDAGTLGIGVARILGVALIAIGVAGWDTDKLQSSTAPKAGLCVYNVGTATALALFGLVGGMGGVLLWPVTVLHAVLGVMTLRLILVAGPKTASTGDRNHTE